MNDTIAALQEIVDSLKDGLPVNEVLATLRDMKLPGCEVEYQTGIVKDPKGQRSVLYEEFVIHTRHPKLDYVHRIDYDLLRPIPAEDKKELGDHLIVVLNAWLREMKRAPAKPKKSRQQADHPITKWVEQFGNGRKDSEAVRAYIELHGGKYDKLYQDLQNDRKKHRKHQPKQG